jgi:hypothetical protein
MVVFPQSHRHNHFVLSPVSAKDIMVSRPIFLPAMSLKLCGRFVGCISAMTGYSVKVRAKPTQRTSIWLELFYRNRTTKQPFFTGATMAKPKPPKPEPTPPTEDE